MGKWRWLAVVSGLMYGGVMSWPLQAAELCISAPVDRLGAIPQPVATWEVMTTPVIELQAPAGDECSLRVAIPKASRFTLQLKELDQKDDWPRFFIRVEKTGQDGTSHILTGVGRNTYLTFDPGWYVIRVERNKFFGEEGSTRPRLRLSFDSYEPFPAPIPALNQDVTFAITAKAAEDVRVQPFRMTQRALVRVRFAPVCYPDLLATKPPRYSVQKLEECKQFGIQPDLQAGSNRPPFSVKVLNAWGRTLYAFSQDDEHVALLPEGQYALGVIRSYDRPSREDVPSGPLNLTATVAEFTPAPLPPAAQALATWLDATGLSADFFIRDFYGVNPTATASCVAERDREDVSVIFTVIKARLCRSTPLSILEQIGIPETDCWLSGGSPDSSAGGGNTGAKDIELVRNPCDPTATPLPVSRSDVPIVLVRLHTTVDKNKLGQLEWDFHTRFGTTLWDRMFLKISSSLRLPQRQIVMHVPVFCTGSVVYWHNGSAEREGWECLSGGASILLASLPDLASSAQSSLAIDIPKIGELIVSIIEKSYTTKGATVEFLERGGSFVEAIIRGLRGEVILGGKDWERVQVSIFALQGEKGTIQLRTLVDGRIASGLGSYPPDSSFTTDMEPRYSGALTEYARRLLDRIQTEFTRRGPSQ